MSPLALRIAPGTDLRRFLDGHVFAGGGRSGFVLAGIGSLTDARLRLAADDQFTTIAGPSELLTISGSLSNDGAHLHVTVADARGAVHGGHLCHGSIVRTTAELLLAEVTGQHMSRAFDPATGYAELVVKPGGDTAA